jgi:hypothetical protein
MAMLNTHTQRIQNAAQPGRFRYWLTGCFACFQGSDQIGQPGLRRQKINSIYLTILKADKLYDKYRNKTVAVLLLQVAVLRLRSQNCFPGRKSGVSGSA